GPDCGPGCSCGKYTELGNDVFMQYEKHHDGSLTPLKQKNVDTGWGLERILAFLNGTRDVYQIDLFSPVIAYIEKVSGTKYEQDENLTRSMRILADHVRTSVMLIGDEAKLLPSNVGAGYVLRRLIRRAVRHGRVLGMTVENILKTAEIFIDDIYAESYPRLKENKEFVLVELKKEINRFESTLENGMKEFRKILEQKKKAGSGEIDGKSAFYLYDTFGFPIELTVEMAQEEGLKVDEDGFAQAMEEQKQKARDNQNFEAKLSTENMALYDSLDASVVSEFVGYETLTAESEIVAISNGKELRDSLNEGEEGTIITYKTPFYATMGGQCADTGFITCGESEFLVEDTVKLPGDRIGHVGKVIKGSLKTGD
ncbi:MAG: alanine--tRNA ligase, partial [Lachnospiraceae bacterium]|nr:alanine--tRNA ligase [Lachnospiraceae bacterium]